MSPKGYGAREAAFRCPKRVIFSAVKSALSRRAAVVFLSLAAAAATGCGNSEPDLVNGKEKFVEGCQRCHMLERAGGGANVGPNLDDAFRNARASGFGENTFEGVVLRQIGNVRRSSTMPADIYEGDDARDVSAYIAAVAAKGGKDTGALAEAGVQSSSKPIVAKGGKLEIPAADAGLAFVSTKAQAMTGAVEFTMPNPQDVQHNIALKDEGGQVVQEGEVVGKGGTSSFSADLKPGTFAFVCTVPGHEEGGMKGEITVK